MSPAAAEQLRALAFGALDGSLWGAVLDRGTPALVVGTDAQSPTAEGVWSGLSWGEGDEGAWTLTGEGVDLTVVAANAPAPADAAADAGAGADADAGGAPGEGSGEVRVPQPPPEGPADQQLCRVTGTVTVGGAQRTVDCVGTRARAEGKAVSAATAARLTAAWFTDAEAIELLALRPAKGQPQETLAATLFDADAWIPVHEPRLSTTYDGEGVPLRAGLELWVTDGEHEYPRRVAGEADREHAVATAPGLTLSVSRLRCHSRGQDGPGVYVLATFAD
jgi:hypothetical protein